MKKHPIYLSCFLLILVFSFLIPLQASAAESSETELINILLIGRDSLDDSPSRSDSIILCSVHPDSKTVAITSFLRDLYLPIPGYQSNRLNAAYAFGGTPLLQQTLQESFDVQPDGCVEVDFSTFPQIIDLLGGVHMELRPDEAEAINKTVPGTLTEGRQLLSGDQALAYSRIRKLDLDGDVSRSSRQRKLIISLLDSYRNASFLTILSTVDDLLPVISTDLSKKEILVLAAKLFPLMNDPSVTSLRIPAEGTYRCQRIRGMDVLVPDLEKNRELLRETMEALVIPKA